MSKEELDYNLYPDGYRAIGYPGGYQVNFYGTYKTAKEAFLHILQMYKKNPKRYRLAERYKPD